VYFHTAKDVLFMPNFLSVKHYRGHTIVLMITLLLEEL